MNNRIKQALKQPAQEPVQPEHEPVAKGKLKVTLQDTPTEIELAQYKRMFEAACFALGAIGDALGVEPEEGGSEPILFAIEELKAQLKEPKPCPTCEALARTVMLDQTSHDTTPPLPVQPQRPWVGLTDEEIAQGNKESWVTKQAWESAVWWASEKLKEKNNG